MTLPARPFRRALIGAGAALVLLGAARADAATWSSLQSAAHARSEATFVVHGGGAFHLNGFDGSLRIRNSVERYDIAADAWETVAETTDSPGFPTALTHAGTVVADGELWLIGGRVGANPGPVTDRVVVFDLETYAWREGPTLPLPFAGGGAALVGRRIHLFGGVDAAARCGVTTHLVHDLDAPGDGWRDLSGSAPFPNPRNHFGTAVLDGRIYVAGGQIGHDDCAALAQQRVQTKLVHVYDPATGAWSRLADLPWPQSHAEPSTFAHAGRLWSVGGMVQGERVLSYDPATDAWTWRDDLDLPSALLAPGARIFGGNRLHLFGGGAPDVFTPRAETWVADVPGLAPEPSGDASRPEDPATEEEPAEVPAPVDDAVAEPVEQEPVPADEAPPADGTGTFDDGAGPFGNTDASVVGDADTTPSDAPVTPVVPTAPVAPVAPTAPIAPIAPIAPVIPAESDDPTDANDPGPSGDAGVAKVSSGGGGGGATAWLPILLAPWIGARVAARATSRPAGSGGRRRRRADATRYTVASSPQISSSRRSRPQFQRYAL